MFFLLTRRERLVLHRLSPHMQRTRPSARFVIVFVRTRAVARKRIGAARFHRITGGVRERSSWSVERAGASGSFRLIRLLAYSSNIRLTRSTPPALCTSEYPSCSRNAFAWEARTPFCQKTTTGAFLSAGSFAGSTNPMFRVSQVALTAKRVL